MQLGLLLLHFANKTYILQPGFETYLYCDKIIQPGIPGEGLCFYKLIMYVWMHVGWSVDDHRELYRTVIVSNLVTMDSV